MFNGTNYVFWKVRMKTYIQSLRVDVWDVVEEEYQRPLVLVTKDHKFAFRCNVKAMHGLLFGLPKLEIVKVMDFKSTKPIWDKMSIYYEGNNKVNNAKLQGFRIQFESLSMHDDEDIAKYFQGVDEVLNTIRGFDEKLDDDVVVQRVLRSLSKSFNSKVSSIEEMENMSTLTLDQLLWRLTAYEKRCFKGKPTNKESTFKAVNKCKGKSIVK